ncbi:regulator of G-protein signaling 9-binding protein [Paramormyrops kingsleyae]|uniref:regulator of G-protein signaling 9-binding protein n=1 Tax=Paramormyrops kingsleyae TaxID=1676925 RepID=UPI000CD6576B|nr:regulator of G-protein signaling 9-binding protein-like [Paramormyrops kingsleyae]
MNRWRRSVGEIQARRRPLLECQRAQAAFVKGTACLQLQAACLGSNSDCSRLREELDETRALAHSLSTGLQKRLTTMLTQGELLQEERAEAERLWVLFLSGLEIFQQDLQKVILLQELFPLKQPRDRRSLVNTGGSGDGTGVTGRVTMSQMPWPKTQDQGGPCPDLSTQISQLESMAQEMLRKVNVPFWSVEATQEAWADSVDTEQDDDEPVEEMSVENVAAGPQRLSGCCHYPGCRVLCLLN